MIKSTRVLQAFTLVFMSASVSSCASADGQTLITTKKAKVDFELFNTAAEPTGLVDESFLNFVGDMKREGFDSKAENKISQLCLGKDIPEEETAFAPLIVAVVSEAISFLLDKVEEKVAKEIKKYTAIYAASDRINEFYTSENGKPELAHKCMRFVRDSPDKDDRAADKRQPAFDLIAQLRLAPGNEAIQIRPLRLYYQEPQASGSQFSTVISLSSNSTWLQGNIGKSQKIFDGTLLKVKRNFSDKDQKNFTYYLDREWNGALTVPLVPWSTNKVPYTGGNVQMTMTVAEAGKLPKYLELAAKLLKSQKDNVAKKLSEAVEGHLAKN